VISVAQVPFSAPVEDSVPKVDNAVAVGEDLDFQRKWWKFEHIIWIVFGVILLADVLGLFGRGYLAKAELHAQDGSLHVKYERVERASTPSTMTINFGPNAIQNGQVRMYVSESLIRELGTQRISPQPAASVVGQDGVTYTFPATAVPAVVQLSLESSFPGRHPFTLQVPGSDPVQANVIVVP
jgi:hypothetical protein